MSMISSFKMKCKDAYESYFDFPKTFMSLVIKCTYTLCCAYKAFVDKPIYIYWSYTVNPQCNIYIIQKENPIYRLK